LYKGNIISELFIFCCVGMSILQAIKWNVVDVFFFRENVFLHLTLEELEIMIVFRIHSLKRGPMLTVFGVGL
jgi:hypothetical protein